MEKERHEQSNDDDQPNETRDDPPPPANTENKNITDTRKQIWLIPIAATVPNVITHTALLERGLVVDEWFYTRADDDGHQIILVHTPKPISVERVVRAVNELGLMTKKNAQPLFTVRGFDMLTSSGGRGKKKDGPKPDSSLCIETYPDFQKLVSVVEKINAGSDEEDKDIFEFWIRDKDAGVLALKKNLMLRSVPNRKRKSFELMDLLYKTEKAANENLKATNTEMQAKNDELQTENGRLKRLLLEHRIPLGAA